MGDADRRLARLRSVGRQSLTAAPWEHCFGHGHDARCNRGQGKHLPMTATTAQTAAPTAAATGDQDAVTFALSGSITAYTVGPIWEEALATLTRNAERRVVIDASDLKTIDNAGIALLFDLKRHARPWRGAGDGGHTSIGSTIDQTFAFPRKVDGAAGWGYINLKGMPDAPTLGTTKGEIHQYLERVCGGDEFRQNAEMRSKFYTQACELDVSKVTSADVHELITPSRERALALNKAYKIIVAEQSFIQGRDATIQPAVNVYQQIDQNVEPLKTQHRTSGDIRLQW